MPITAGVTTKEMTTAVVKFGEKVKTKIEKSKNGRAKKMLMMMKDLREILVNPAAYEMKSK